MKNYLSIILSLFLVFGLVVGTTAQEKEAFEYGGVATCKACHFTKKSGAQYKIWADSPHAKAFETLQSDAAKAVAKKMGIEDPAASDKCLKCHVTAHGVDAKLKGAKYTMEEGVGCESCHGPGSAYKGRKVMQDLYAGKLKAADYGLVKPVTEEVCMSCHNKENPTHKGFDFEKQVAKIAHPVPKE